MTFRTVAVVGHVDHGKTSLVKALTGTDTDTLKEEKERGLTISLGFAHHTTKSGIINLIDAPGHADFVRTTVSGLSGADAILLVISAVEGIQTQTLEHVELARLLGIHHAITAITKTDLCTKEAYDALVVQATNLLKRKGFIASPIVSCSTQLEGGIDVLEVELRQLFKLPLSPSAPVGFYLPVDRVFSQTGAGTVVTGTLLGGAMQIDDEAVIQPANEAISIRNLHANGEHAKTADSGTRIAVALRGTSAQSVSKGDVLCAASLFESSALFDVMLELSDPERLKLKHMEHVTVLHGTGHAAARVRLFEPSGQQDGQAIYAQLKFSKKQISFAGQRFVLRRPASAVTIAGGTILDPVGSERLRAKRLHVNVLEKAGAGNLSALALALSERDGGCVGLDEITRLSRHTRSDIAGKLSTDFEFDEQGHAFRKNDLDDLKTAYIKILSQMHKEHPCCPHVSLQKVRRALRVMNVFILGYAEQSLMRSQVLYINKESVALCEHDPFAVMNPDQLVAFDLFESCLKEVGISPLRHADLQETRERNADFSELLIWCGRALNLYNHGLNQHILLHTSAVKNAHVTLSSAYPRSVNFTTSEARALLDTSRKIVVPVLEYFDQQGVTLRQGNERSILKDTFEIMPPKDAL